MSLTAWPTSASGDTLTAAFLNTYLRDNGRWMTHNATGGAPMCRVYNTLALSISNVTDVMLTFDTDRFDIGAMHDTSSLTERITIPASSGGKYLIGGAVSWSTADTDGSRLAYLRLNGSGSTRPAISSTAGNLVAPSHVLAAVWSFAAAEYFEIGVYQDCGGSLNVLNASNYSPEAFAVWIGE